MKMPVLKALICCASLGVGGCASSQMDPSQYSGFLKDYSRLKPAESATGAPVMRWIAPDVKLSKYTQVYIEPSQFYPKPQPTAVISAQTLQSITRYFDTALQRELGKNLRIVSGPGPDTIIVRPAITAVSTSTQGLKPYEVVPIALVAGIRTSKSPPKQRFLMRTPTRCLPRSCAKAAAPRWKTTKPS